MATLSETFLSSVEKALRPSYAALEALEDKLDKALTAARAGWPDLAVDAERFLGHLGRHAPAVAEDCFAHLRPPDLYLALGCVEGDEQALAAFEQEFGGDIRNAIRRFECAALTADDLHQALHERLFVGKSGKPAKLGAYSGQGFLQNWVRVTAVRTFSDMVRSSKRLRETPEEDFAQLADGDDLELSFLKKRYRRVFKEAFEEAVAALDSRDRNLLRHSVLSGLSIDQIAAVYHVHRATAARRVVKARETLVTETRRGLMKRLQIDSEELESLMQLIASNLDVSIDRVLGSSKLAEG